MKLKQLREAKGLSQAALAEKVGVSREYIARLEAGHHDPPLSTIERLARALSVKVAAMIGDDRQRYLSNASVVGDFLKNEFPHHSVYEFDAHDRSTRGYRIETDPSNEIRHRVEVSREFLVDYSEGEVISLLKSWQLAEKVRAAGLAKVMVTRTGVRVIGKK